MSDCIFCKIINKQIPCHKIYEDNNCLAFLDIANDSYGHTLVVPKEHFENILTAPSDVLDECINAVQNISEHFVNTLGFGGVHIFNNCGEVAGQSVMHLHFHIIPRASETTGEKVDLTETDLAKIAEILKYSNN